MQMRDASGGWRTLEPRRVQPAGGVGGRTVPSGDLLPRAVENVPCRASSDAAVAVSGRGCFSTPARAEEMLVSLPPAGLRSELPGAQVFPSLDAVQTLPSCAPSAAATVAPVTFSSPALHFAAAGSPAGSSPALLQGRSPVAVPVVEALPAVPHDAVHPADVQFPSSSHAVDRRTLPLAATVGDVRPRPTSRLPAAAVDLHPGSGDTHGGVGFLDGVVIPAATSSVAALVPSPVSAANMAVAVAVPLPLHGTGHVAGGEGMQVDMVSAVDVTGPACTSSLHYSNAHPLPGHVNVTANVPPLHAQFNIPSAAPRQTAPAAALVSPQPVCTHAVCPTVGCSVSPQYPHSCDVETSSKAWTTGFSTTSVPGTAWRGARVTKLPPLADLGTFSNDGNTALLDAYEVAATSGKFQEALVGRLFGRRLPFPILSGELHRRWASFGNFKIVTLSGDCFMCLFDAVGAAEAVLLGGPWVIFGQVLGIARWTPLFSPSSGTGFCTPVWVRLPGLPLYCWSPLNIARITALLGEPLWLDEATAHFDRGAFARTCVRLDLSKPLRPGVWVDGPHGAFFQPLVYEGLSVFCWRCGRVGHKEGSCPLQSASRGRQSPLHPAPTVDSPLIPPVASPHTLAPMVAASSQPPPGAVLSVGIDAFADRGVGPWMVVTRKKRPGKGRDTPSRRPQSTWVPISRGAGPPSSSIAVYPPVVREQPPVSRFAAIASRDSPRACSPPLPPVVQCIAASVPVLADPPTGALVGSSLLPVCQDDVLDALHPGALVPYCAPASSTCSRSLKVARMLSDLGPISQTPRKRRLTVVPPDGGVASPSLPP